jgi:hypothetical protein
MDSTTYIETRQKRRTDESQRMQSDEKSRHPLVPDHERMQSILRTDIRRRSYRQLIAQKNKPTGVATRYNTIGGNQ